MPNEQLLTDMIGVSQLVYQVMRLI